MRISYTNFTAGEFNPSLSSRYDLAKYKSSCRYVENFLPDLHGSLRRRPGLRFLDSLATSDNKLVVFPNSFGTYLLQFTPSFVHVYSYKDNAVNKLSSLAFSALTKDCLNISYACSGNIMYIAHEKFPLHKIVANASGCTLSQVVFNTEVSLSALELRFSSRGDYNLRYKVVGIGKNGLAISSHLHFSNSQSKHPNDWVVGDYAVLRWRGHASAVEYNIYREEAGAFGLIGIRDAKDTNGTANEYTFRDDKYIADMRDCPKESCYPYGSGNYPSCVCFHQQRLILGGGSLTPQTWYASCVGNYEDFSRSRPPRDDDALEFTIASGRLEPIQWISSFGDLFIGTESAEYRAIGSDQGVLTPSSLNIREQSFWGSSQLPALLVGNSLLHVQKFGKKVRDLSYAVEKDAFSGNDLSILASHLFDESEESYIKEWCYQKFPTPRIYCLLHSGNIVVLTYLKEHDIWAWSRITTQGKFTSLSSSADKVFVIVDRGQNTTHYLECFDPEWKDANKDIYDSVFLDAYVPVTPQHAKYSSIKSLLDARSDKVIIIGDGFISADNKDASDTFVPKFYGKKVVAGFAYPSIVHLQNPELEIQDRGSSLGVKRSYGLSSIRLVNSAFGEYGNEKQGFTPFKYDVDPKKHMAQDFNKSVPERETGAEEIILSTGDISFTPDLGFSSDNSLFIRTDMPAPLTISSVSVTVEMQG